MLSQVKGRISFVIHDAWKRNEARQAYLLYIFFRINRVFTRFFHEIRDTFASPDTHLGLLTFLIALFWSPTGTSG